MLSVESEEEKKKKLQKVSLALQYLLTSVTIGDLDSDFFFFFSFVCFLCWVKEEEITCIV